MSIKKDSLSIVLIGAGKVAHHLGAALQQKHHISCVWSRSTTSAQKLGEQLNCPFSIHLHELKPDADLYIFMLSDDAIAPIAQALAQHISPNSLVVHTSGATASTVFEGHFQRYGIFYPLQSFSYQAQINWTKLPICIHAQNDKDLRLLQALAQELSEQVYLLNDQQRAHLHLSAVFVNNFTNYMQHIAQELMQTQELPYALLQPLLQQTVDKLQHSSAMAAQTGPAIRADQATLSRHIRLLDQQPEWQKIYQLLSEGIVRDLGKYE